VLPERSSSRPPVVPAVRPDISSHNMYEIKRAFLAEKVLVDGNSLRGIVDEVRGHFGPRQLPWTVELVMVVALWGPPNARGQIRIDVFAPNHSDPFFFVQHPISIFPSGKSDLVIPVGPVRFVDSGEYRFVVQCEDASVTVTATLQAAPGE
jgi:hypothetical protein